MAAAAPAAAAALRQQAIEDVEMKRHKRNPFGSQFVALATSSFGASTQQPQALGGMPQQDGAGRAAVEAAAADVHLRTELIRSMKNALVKQTAEAVKRAAPPPGKQRLGGRARQAAATAAAAGAGRAHEGDAGEKGDVAGAALFTEADAQMHQQLQLLLQGSMQPELGAVMQGLLCREGDATRLSEAELSMDPTAELAPPPFDAFLQQLLGDEVLQPAPQLSRTASGEAGLAAAVQALCQHTARLEEQGLLHIAAADSGWMLPEEAGEGQAMLSLDDGFGDGLGWHGGRQGQWQRLPDYLAGEGQQQQQQQHVLMGQQQMRMQERRSREKAGQGSFQHWPAWQPAEAADIDAIQDVDDDGAAWQALEGPAASSQAGTQQRVPLALGLAGRRQDGPAAAVAVSFDDEPHCHQFEQQQQQRMDGARGAAGVSWQQQQQMVGAPAQARLSEVWEQGGGGDEGDDPWMELEAGPAAPTRQYPLQPPGPTALRVPTFASRRQPLALGKSQAQGHTWQQQGVEDVDDDEEEWDEAMLAQVAALEQLALAGQRQAQAPPASQPQRHAPVFRNRAFAQQHQVAGGVWPGTCGPAGSECIEDADSDEEPPASLAASAAARAAGAGARRAVPQLGRRSMLPLAPAAAGGAALADQSAWDNQEDVAAGTGAAGVPGAAGPAGKQPTLGGRRQAAPPPAEAAAESHLLRIDFASIDVSALRPCVLLTQAGTKQRWKPAYDAEALLLPHLRDLLPAVHPTPPLQPPQPQPAGQGLPHIAPQSHAAELVAGLTAEDLEGWDNWEEEGDCWDGGATNAAANASAAAAAGQRVDGGAGQGPWQQQQQDDVPQQGRWEDEAVDLEWYDPPSAEVEAPPSQPHPTGQMAPAQGTMAFDQLPAPQGRLERPAASAAAAVAGRGSAVVHPRVEVCFEEEDDDGTDAGNGGNEEDVMPQAWWGGAGASQDSQWGVPLAGDQSAAGHFGAPGFGWAAEPSQQMQQWQQPDGQRSQPAGFYAAWAFGQPGSPDLPASSTAAAAAAEDAGTAVVPPGSPDDVWAEFDGEADGSADERQQPMDGSIEGEAVAAVHWDDEEQPATLPRGRRPADSVVAARMDRAAADPWAALEAHAADVQAPFGSPTSTSALDQARGAAGGPAPAPASSPSRQALPDSHLGAAPAEAGSLAEFAGLWGCNIAWEEDPVMQQEEAEPAAGPGPHSAAGPSSMQEREGMQRTGDEVGGNTAPASAQGQGLMGAFEWAYDEADTLEQQLQGGFQAAAAGMGMAARLALGQDGARHAAPASKRRHEQIGAEIIRALLEERQRDRVDLQPLLRQLCLHLAAALAGGGAALLSTLHLQCQQGGEAAAEASPQRYLMALLTVAHQHNSGAASRARQQLQRQGGDDSDHRSGGAAVAATVAPLAEALGQRQLRLSAVRKPDGTTDVAIVAG